ncbi:centrosomal protein of 78 kda-like [Plakobranchus ocellatus]|uniref:Centrosomal protein of 78 kDa-like n=1 Tax=Plakobranchus ocellatus TaxID=259542 RepID=A0AAV4AM77_9GAST|nr:centrosomal protein of 78 kda-like [Plakobranchus ocellatus]
MVEKMQLTLLRLNVGTTGSPETAAQIKMQLTLLRLNVGTTGSPETAAVIKMQLTLLRLNVTPKSTRRSARTSGLMGKRVEVTQSPGLPWRTAARANRFRGHPPDVARYPADQSSDLSTSLLFTSTQGHLDEDDSASEVVLKVDPHSGGVTMDAAAAGGGSFGSKSRATEAMMRELEESHMAMDLNNTKEVKIELEQMRRHLREERLARAKSDQKVVHLMIENRRLTEEVAQLKKAQNGTRLAEDEAFLESVEASFKQFHAFIDMLREAGMGQLVTIAGLDQSAMPFANGSSDYISSNSSGNGVGRNSRHHSNINSNNNNNNSSDNDAAPNPDTTYANMPLASSAFVKSRQQHQQPQQQRHSPGDPSGSHSMASFTEGEPLVIGSQAAGRGEQMNRGRVYGDESEAAKQEADELYSRLVQETRGALTRPEAEGASKVISSTGSSPVRPAASVNIAKALAESGGGGAGGVGRAQGGWTDSRDGQARQHIHEAGRLTYSPDKSGASLSVDEEIEDVEEEPSSPGISGRGQDDSGAGLQATPFKDIIDSQDEDF